MNSAAMAQPAAVAAIPTLRQAIRRLVRLTRESTVGLANRLRLYTAVAIALIGKLLSVLAPLVIAAGVNALASGQASGFRTFFALAVVWSALRFFSSITPWLSDGVFMPLSEDMKRRAGTRVFSHMLALPAQLHHSISGGVLYQLIDHGLRALDFLSRYLTLIIAPALIEFLLAMGVMIWRYSLEFAIIAASTVFVYAAVSFYLADRHLQRKREMVEQASAVTSRVYDSLANFEAIKTFTAETSELARYDTAAASYARAAVEAKNTIVWLNFLQDLIMGIGLAALVITAGGRVIAGALGPGDILAIVLIMLNLYVPLSILGYSYREIRQTSIDLERMFAILDERPDPDPVAAKPLANVRGEIAFENVCFRFEGRDRGLENISFVARAGETTAIVGRSGVGKSAIVKLICRFYQPNAGRIVIDGTDLRDLAQRDLRTLIGLAPQDVVLFNDTIRHNIAYGCPDATQAQLEQAAAQAQVLELIESLPRGWETRVGERGVQLSGGERQRIGIARAILAKPPVLVFDEATSWLDAATETRVRDAIAQASAGRTAILVAHRLSTIALADQIVMLDEGKVAEHGAHAALLANDGAYARFWRGRAPSAS